MENNATYELMPLMAAKATISRLFKSEPNDGDFIENAMTCLKKIGNLHSDVYFYRGLAVNGIVELPCNVSVIESVSAGDLYFNGNNLQEEKFATEWFVLGLNRYDIRGYNVYRGNVSNLKPHGHYINYSFRGDRLELKNNYINTVDPNHYNHEYPVNVIYRGQIVDDKGLPMVTEKEILAIAYYQHYIDMHYEFLMNGINALQKFQLAETLKDRHINQARVPEHVSQNAMNQILNAKTSMHRHFYGDRTNPIR